MEVIADEKLHPPDEVAGWERTRSSKESEYPGISYKNPQADREFVIVGTVSLTQTDTVIFKFNPHKRPGDRKKVTGFNTYNASLKYAVEWMRDNPIGDNNMSGQDTGLHQFAGGTDDSQDEEEKTETVKGNSKESSTTDKQEHPNLILKEYTSDGELIGPSPVAEGYEYAETLPAQEEWHDNWVNKTEDFDHYEEGRDDRTRFRKRVVCECGLRMDVTGTAFSVMCHGCNRYLIDLNPADQPSKDTNSTTNSKPDIDAEQIGFKDNDSSSEPDTDQDDEDEGASGLQAFVDNNS